jgi:hypothetical protein
MMAIIFTMSATTTTFTIPEGAESAWLVYMNSLETKLLKKKGLMFVFVKLLIPTTSGGDSVLEKRMKNSFIRRESLTTF